MAEEPKKAKAKGNFFSFGKKKKAPEQAPIPAAPGVPAPAPATPSTPKMATPQNPDDKNVFTELFGDDKAAKSAGMMDTVLKQEDTKSKSFFGKKPKLKTVSKPGTTKSRQKARMGKSLLQWSILTFVLVLLVSYSQNSKSFGLFGENPAQRVGTAQEQRDLTQADVTVEKYLTAVLLLDEYSTIADQYFFNLSQAESEFVSSNKRTSHLAALEDLQPEMIDVLEEVKLLIKGELTPEIKTLARERINVQISEMKKKEGSVDEQSLLQEVQDLESTRNLLTTKEYLTLVKGLDTDAPKPDELRKVAADFNMKINKSVSALIGSIREERALWSQVFNELERVTKAVDPLFGTQFENNIRLNDIKFGKKNLSVDLSGSSITDDTKNFTLTSNYLDALEVSEIFEEVEERRFSKNTIEDNYRSSFRISMTLTTEDNE